MSLDRRPGTSFEPVARPMMRRLGAAFFDMLIVLGWAAFAGVIGLTMTLLGVTLDTALAQNLTGYLTLVLPVTLTFAFSEAGPRQQTPGKRRRGLSVVDLEDQPIGLGRSIARSVVKFVPWQMAHTAVYCIVAGRTDWGILALSVFAQIIVLGSFLTMALRRDHRAWHDLIVGTRIATG